MLQQQSHRGLETHRQREAAVVRAQWTAAMAHDEDTRYRAGTPSTATNASLSRPMTASSRPTTAATAAVSAGAAAGNRPSSPSAQGSSRTGSRGSSRRHKRASCSDASSNVCDASECATEAVPVENFFKRVPALQRRAAAHDSAATCTCSSNTVFDSTAQSALPTTDCCTQCVAVATANAIAVQSTVAATINPHSSVSSGEATVAPAAASTIGSTELSVSARVYTLVRIVAGKDWRVPGHELIVTDALTDLLAIARYTVHNIVYLNTHTACK
jgi:hypothetical protein